MKNFNIVRGIQQVLLVFTLLISCQLSASNASFLKYGVMADFTESDLQQLQKAYLHVLQRNKPGDIHSWVGTNETNGGKITVMKQYRQNDAHCKRLKFNSHSKSQSATSYFNFCLIDAQWKLVN